MVVALQRSVDSEEPQPSERHAFPPRKPSPPLATYRKPCTLCSTRADVLVRCQTDASGAWYFVCPGSCWKQVSGGIIDGDKAHPHYRYGGMWKNKHAGVSAKMKGNRKEKKKKRERAGEKTNERVEASRSSLIEREG